MSSLLVFPGQGAQRPGMLQQLPANVLDEASDTLGQEVRQLDSAQALASTRAVQLCLLIAGVAHARQLQRIPDYVAGLSIGAYPAAVIAGALEFADALRLVSLRGELMQHAYPQGYGMTALIGLELSTVESVLAEVHSTQTPVYLANINADNQCVIAGSDTGMQRVADRVKGQAVAKRLAVSVPSHCALLEQPAEALAEAFAKVALHAPAITYLSSTRARSIRDPAQLRDINDARDGQVARLARAWRAGGQKAAIIGQVLVHGNVAAGGGSLFALYSMPAADTARQAYLLELLLPCLHLHWLALQDRGRMPMAGLAVPRAASARELEVLHWVREGKSNDEVGQILGISGTTVKSHLQRIYKLLGVSNRTQAVSRGIALRLLSH